MNYSFNLFSSIGLVIDIIGVWILFKYGLPSNLKEHGGAELRDEPPEEEQVREKANKKIKLMARLGLSLLILGFLFQLIGTNISNK